MGRGCNQDRLELNRRRFVGYFTSVGLGSTLLPGTLLAVAQEAEEITMEMVAAAARLAGLSLSQEEEERVARSLNGERSLLRSYGRIRDLRLDNGAQLAFVFNPVPPSMELPTERRPLRMSTQQVSRPATDDELAFLTVRQLSELIRTRQITSTELTKIYLSRLQRYDPLLHCVVNLTEDLALRQARRADEEIAAGHYRGPLHGIPWGAKDLLAVRGYPTTWGASPFKDQILDLDSTVYTRLTEAGAVLVAKLSMGALAQGDRWFRERTRNPWDPDQGSSGSSAGPGAATAAGLVGFSIGTETRGSIISPATRCGVTGLRPTFGRVSRYGAMALSWTMDKIGPMCRCAEDCALVLAAICGPDRLDNTLIDVPFNWDATRDLKRLRVGVLKSILEREISEDPERAELDQRFRQTAERDREALEVMRSLGVDLKPVELPELPIRDIGFILTTEAAAAFEELTRSGRDRTMTEEPESSRWPDAFRLHRLVPAVEYIQANRVRYRMIEALNAAFSDIDLFVGSSLSLTNLTGHPEISLPHGFTSRGAPTSLKLTGRLFGEEDILLLAHAFQSRTDHHLKRPEI